MPIIEHDPWRKQYFTDVTCPDHVIIPTDDTDAYALYPRYHFIYNKLFIADSQGIGAAPHGVTPTALPVFSKPIYNLQGMGKGSFILRSLNEYREAQAPGHMWMELLRGAHVSTDVAVLDGCAVWWRHTTGKPLPGGTFDDWTVAAEAQPALENYIGAWIGKHLAGYTGMMNFETIGGKIIEAHLRFADQWPDLYGAGWAAAMVGLYADKVWQFKDRDRRTGWSVILFMPHGRAYKYPPSALQAEVLALPGISSLQLTFREDRPPHWHSMPPGGFRVAVINCHDREAGEKARGMLRAWFEKEEQAA